MSGDIGVVSNTESEKVGKVDPTGELQQWVKPVVQILSLKDAMGNANSGSSADGNHYNS